MTTAQSAAARRRRDVKAPGGLLGQFVYTPVSTTPGFTAYTVSRISDNRQLGTVRRRVGGSHWEWAGPEAPRTFHVRDGYDTKPARRGWAADALDAQSLRNVWCGCGVAVGDHDRATRAACRAFARWDSKQAGGRDGVARRAAHHSRPRGRHYDVEACVHHAAQYVKGLVPGQVWLVEPGTAPVHNAWVRHDDRHGCVAVTRVTGGRFGDTTLYPAEYTLETVCDLAVAQGLVVAYDWRR